MVTYNRHDLLVECLDRAQGQSRPPDHLLVVDNASIDETPEMLAQRSGVEALRLEQNLGGAGGFARGIQKAFDDGYGWIWLLDDDTFVDRRCLESLLGALRRVPTTPRLLSSVVRWRDDTPHPMNRPWLRLKRRAEFTEAAAKGLVLVRATSMLSAMISREAVAEHGLPPAHFFLWLDDVEYTGRILRDSVGYMVPESIAWHWTPRPYNPVTDTRGRFYYFARNSVWLLRGPSFTWPERLQLARRYVRALLGYLWGSEQKVPALLTAARGIKDGLRTPPSQVPGRS